MGLALPFRRLVVAGVKASSWRRDLGRTEGSGRLARPMAVAVTGKTDDVIVVLDRMSPVTRTGGTAASSSVSSIVSIKQRTRSRRPLSIGSNQSSKILGAASAPRWSAWALMVVMAWPPVRRSNVGWFEVDHPGD
jgi:hypothetical protein